MAFGLPALNFPALSVPLKSIQKRPYLFDPVRKKQVPATPEEWVRQHCITYLLSIKHFPAHRVLVERELEVFGLRKRFDILVIDRNGKGRLLVECKAPEVPLAQDAFDQIGRYNLALGSEYLWITNGLDHHMFRVHQKEKRFEVLPDLPHFDLISEI